MRVCTLRRSTNGGSTTTSTDSKSRSLRLNAIFCTRAIASKWLRFIFQLPAISGRRVGGLGKSGLQYGDAGQGPALQELQRRSAAGRNVTEVIFGQTEGT